MPPLLKSRHARLLNVIEEDEDYNTLKAALEPWSDEQGWTSKLSEAALISSEIEAVLEGLAQAFDANTDDKVKEYAVFCLSYLKTLMGFPRLLVVQELSSMEPPLYETVDVLKIWEAYLSTARSASTEYIVSSADGTGSTRVKSLTKSDGTMYECAVVGHPPSLRLISGLAICVVNDSEDDQKLGSTLATAVRLVTAPKIPPDADSTRLLKRIVCAYNIRGGHFVLGVLDVDSTNAGVMRFFDPTNMFVNVPAKPNNRLNAKLLGLASLDVSTQPGVMQQHDLSSSGPIVAENGLDYLKLGKGMRKPALSSICPVNARDMRTVHRKRYGVLPATADPSTGAADVAVYMRNMYVAFASMMMIAKTAEWGKEIENWMTAKAEQATADSTDLHFKSADDILMATRMHVEMIIRQNSGVGTLVDDLVIELLFSLHANKPGSEEGNEDPVKVVPLKQNQPGGVYWNENTVMFLSLNYFTQLVSMKMNETAIRAKDLSERYANVVDALDVLKNQHQESIGALNEEAGKSTSQRINELQEKIQKADDDIKILEDATEKFVTQRQGIMDLLTDMTISNGGWDPNADMDNVVDDFNNAADQIDAEIDQKTESEKNELDEQANQDRRQQKQHEIEQLETKKAGFLADKTTHQNDRDAAIAAKKRLIQEHATLVADKKKLDTQLTQATTVWQNTVKKQTETDAIKELTKVPTQFYQNTNRKTAFSKLVKLENVSGHEKEKQEIRKLMDSYFRNDDAMKDHDRKKKSADSSLSSAQSQLNAHVNKYEKKYGERFALNENTDGYDTYWYEPDHFVPGGGYYPGGGFGGFGGGHMVKGKKHTMHHKNKEKPGLNRKWRNLKSEVTKYSTTSKTEGEQRDSYKNKRDTDGENIRKKVVALDSILGRESRSLKEEVTLKHGEVKKVNTDISNNGTNTRKNETQQGLEQGKADNAQELMDSTDKMIARVEQDIASIQASIPQGKTVIICSFSLCPAHSACLPFTHFQTCNQQMLSRGVGWIEREREHR